MDKLLHNVKLLRYGSHAASALIALVVLSLAVVALYQPLRMKERMIEEEIFAAHDLLLRGASLRERHRLAAADDMALQNELLELKRSLPSSAEEAQFIHALSDLASQRSVTLSKFSPGAAQKIAEFRILEIHVTGAGGYASVCSFLHALPELKRVFTIERLQLSSDSATGDDCSFEIAIRLLYTSEPTLVAVAQQP